MNLGNIIRDAAGRYTGRTRGSGSGRGTRGMNTGGRARNTTGGVSGRAGSGGIAGKILGMLKRR